MEKSSSWISALLLKLVALTVGPSAADAADYAGAFLETGMGARGLGITGSFTAAADDAAAAVWNPAALSRVRGARLLAVSQPGSFDPVNRRLTGLAAAWNQRGGLGFGFAWIDAGVGDLVGRSVSGHVTGDIDASQSAFFFALGVPLNRLAFGFAVKLLSHDIGVPERGTSSATGRGLDLGFQYELSPRTRVAATVRNLKSRMSWSVNRSSQQTSKSDDDLPAVFAIGAAHEFGSMLLLAADVQSSSVDTDLDTRLEWTVSPLLSLRAGLDRVGQSSNSAVFGLTLRPMRVEVLQFHYTYLTDELDAGSTTAFGFSGNF